MPTYTRRRRLDVPPEVAYHVISDPALSPHYVTRLTSTEPAAGDRVGTTAVIGPGPGQQAQEVHREAWFTADPDTRQIAWGAPGPHHYEGSMRVESTDDGASTVVLEIHTDADHAGMDAEIDTSLDRLESAARR